MKCLEKKIRIGLNQLAKSYSPKNDSVHLSSATEYVLVYAKNKGNAKTELLARTEEMNSKYSNPDNDPEGNWTSGDPCARTKSEKDRYAIQSPFTGDLHIRGRDLGEIQKRI